MRRLLALCLLTSAAHAQPTMTVAPAHALLAQMSGTWVTEVTTYGEGSDGVGRGHARNRLVMGGLGLSREHHAFGGGRFQGYGFLTWVPGEGHYAGLWMDNFSFAGPAHSTGTFDPKTQTLTEQMQAPAVDGAVMHFTVVTQWEGRDRYTTTFYLVPTPGGPLGQVLMRLRARRAVGDAPALPHP